MSLASVREELHRARERLVAGDTAAATDGIDRALEELEPARVLTPAQAAEALGVESANVVRYWCDSGFLNCGSRDGCLTIPLGEVDRVRESAEVTATRIADQYLAASAELGGPDEMSETELDDLTASRPGTLPWQRR